MDSMVILRWNHPVMAREDFVANLEEVKANTLADKECQFCGDEFQDGEQTAAVRLACGHVFGKDCVLTHTSGRHQGSKLCPICRHKLWILPIEDPEPAHLSEISPEEQAFVHFTSLIESSGAILRCHNHYSLVDREDVLDGLHVGSIHPEMHHPQPVDTDLIMTSVVGAGKNRKWRSAALRAAFMVTLNSRDIIPDDDLWPATFRFLDARFLGLMLPDRMHPEEQEAIDQDFKIYRQHELIIAEFLRPYQEVRATPRIRGYFREFALRRIQSNHEEMRMARSDGNLPWTVEQQLDVCLKVFDALLLHSVRWHIFIGPGENYMVMIQRHAERLRQEILQRERLLDEIEQAREEAVENALNLDSDPQNDEEVASSQWFVQTTSDWLEDIRASLSDEEYLELEELQESINNEEDLEDVAETEVEYDDEVSH